MALASNRLTSVLLFIFIGGFLVLYVQWRALPLGTYLLRKSKTVNILPVQSSTRHNRLGNYSVSTVAENVFPSKVIATPVRVDGPPLVIAYCVYEQSKRRFVSYRNQMN